jgi:DNA-binding protein H-NS
MRARRACEQKSSFRCEMIMRKKDLNTMKFNELWRLHEELTRILAKKILAEKQQLEKRLAQLNRSEIAGEGVFVTAADSSQRRKYPRVLPKYRNPLSPSETWSGRGKTPRWLVSALKTGHKIDDFKIAHTGAKTE